MAYKTTSRQSLWKHIEAKTSTTAERRPRFGEAVVGEPERGVLLRCGAAVYHAGARLGKNLLKQDKSPDVTQKCRNTGGAKYTNKKRRDRSFTDLISPMDAGAEAHAEVQSYHSMVLI